MIKKYLLFTYKSFRQISYLAKESKIVLYLVLVLMGGVQSVYSQATFTTTATAAELKNAMEAEGVIITNPVITIGSLTQRGVFSNGKLGAGLEIDKGIALTTSSIVNAFSTNTELANSDSFLANHVDMDLRQLNSGRTDDVVIFEFDFVEKPNYNGVLIEYQFASDEYPDYVGSTFNDLFGFFVSDPSSLDPNIPDGDLNNNGVYDTGEEPALNLAIVPGSTNYVAINNINVGSPGASSSNPPLGDFTKGAFYINNGHANDDGSSITPIPTNTNAGPKPLFIEFNGATKKLPTNMNLIEGVTYHMKIVIADLEDGSYDSGVFISGITSLPELVSKNDSGIVTENIGGVAVQNVLINDMRAGNVNPLISEVELTQISTSNSGVSLDVNTGAVNVTAGTPVGVYQLEYSICDPSPNNCSNSFVYITVLSDNDNDGIADIDDLDDDNDGVLDLNEIGDCGKTGVWTDLGNGIWESSISTNLKVRVTMENLTTYWDAAGFPQNGAFDSTCANFDSDYGPLGGLDGLQVLVGFQPSQPTVLNTNFIIEYIDTDGNPVKMENPKMHWAGIGGTNGNDLNTSEWTLQGGKTARLLSSFNGMEIVNSGTTIRKAGLGTDNGQGAPDCAGGEASGTISINGVLSGYTFNVIQYNSNGAVDFTAGDGIDFIFEGCALIDTDKDGVPNKFDTDSDGDGCSDADEAYFGSVNNADADNNGTYGSGSPDVNPTDGKVTAASYNTPNAYYLDATINTCNDNDNDGVVDDIDLDDDNDGILDTNECPAPVIYNDSFEVPAIQASGPNLTDKPDSDNDGEVDMFISQTSIEGWSTTDVNSFDVVFDLYNASKGNQSIDLYGTPSATGIQKTYTGFTEGIPVDFSLDYSSVVGLFEATISVDYGAGPVLLTTLSPNNVASSDSPNTAGSRISSIVWTTYSTSLTPTTAGTIKIIIQSTSLGAGQSGVLIDNVSLSQTACRDTDNDGIQDSLDTDSDNDGCPDALEAAGTFTPAQVANSLTGGSVGGSLLNFGTTVNTKGIPTVVTGGSITGSETVGQANTAAVLDANNKTACEADLSIIKKVNKAVPKKGTTVIFTLSLKNDGPVDATGVTVKDLLPAGLTYNSAASTIPVNTTYTASTGIWDLSVITIAKNQTIELKIAATVTTTGAIITNKTEVFFSNQPDTDSTPNSNN